MALLTRYPVSAWQVVRLPRIRPRFPLYLREPRKVIVVHEEPRAAVVASIDTPAGPLAVACTHLSFVPGWGRWQLRRLRQGLDRVEGPVVIMGDLNMPGDVPARLTGYRPLARRATFPAEEPVRPARPHPGPGRHRPGDRDRGAPARPVGPPPARRRGRGGSRACLTATRRRPGPAPGV